MKSKKIHTHTGFLVGTDSRTGVGYKRKVLLRELKVHWITDTGSKYRKESGSYVGDIWAINRLDLDSITALEVPIVK